MRVVLTTLLVLLFSISANFANAAPLPSTFADLAEKYAPAVVNISTAGAEEPAPNTQTQKDGTPFEELFEELFKNAPSQNAPRNSLGSGVIISPDGYVITNNHVVEGATEIIVKLNNEAQDELKAKLIGRDKKNDLALIKVSSRNRLPYAPLGDSSKLRVGDWVMAIGNPFGLGGSVTAGIVSAMGRNINLGPYDDFIQTDAAINPGNSGGPLFDVNGNIVGINTAILSRSGGSQGIGFAVPSNTVQLIIDQIKQHGRPVRGWLGVIVQTVTKDLATAFGIKRDDGALVVEVSPGSPAAKAGFKRGDIILQYNKQTLKEMTQLPKMVAQTNIGETVPLLVVRDGKEQVVNVTIAELEEPDNQPIQTAQKTSESKAVLGMDVSPITPELRNRYRLSQSLQGVMVVSTDFGGPADQAGLTRGDVITEANKKPVKGIADLRDATLKSQGKIMLLLIRRGSENRFIAMRVPK